MIRPPFFYPSPFQNRPDLVDDFFQGRLRNLSLIFRSSHLPVNALHLVGEYHPSDPGNTFEGDLEGVSLHLGRDGAAEDQAGLPVIRRRRQYEGG